MIHVCSRQPDETPPHTLKPWQYCFWQGRFMFCSGKGLLADLSRHLCIVNKTGTLSVAPSILVSNGAESDHGFITDSEWRDA